MGYQPAQSGFTKLRFQIKNLQQSAKADVLTDHHAEFEDLGIIEFNAKPFEEAFINGVVVHRQHLGVFDRHLLTRCEVSTLELWFVEACNFLFSEPFFHRRWKSCVESGETVIEPGDLEADQFFQIRLDDAA